MSHKNVTSRTFRKIHIFKSNLRKRIKINFFGNFQIDF